jgi:hypothetical protein
VIAIRDFGYAPLVNTFSALFYLRVAISHRVIRTNLRSLGLDFGTVEVFREVTGTNSD